jgi:nitrite reductase/ring-hydroxylating ferredoxin subunit
MDRKHFLKASCIACSSIGFLASILESCAPVKYTSGNIQGNDLVMDLNAFDAKKGGRSYVIIRHDDLQYPICVYRIAADNYSAVWMRCSHQGAELQAAGDQLVCPAHGSEFDKYGKATQAPATTDLRTFPVAVKNNQLFIDLRAAS